MRCTRLCERSEAIHPFLATRNLLLGTPVKNVDHRVKTTRLLSDNDGCMQPSLSEKR